MKIALVYDRVNKIGGAERVLLALHEIWPEAPLYTAVYDKKGAPWADDFKVIPSFIQKIPFAKNHHELFPWLTPLAFESFNFDEYDVAISITSAEAKGIITKPETLHICYCLTPTRYLWNDFQIYRNSIKAGILTPLARLIMSAVASKLRIWDQIGANRPDEYIAISENVAKRIKKYYHHNSLVLYPPVDINKFSISSGSSSVKGEKYFLVVSRLVPYKRIEIAIKAFNKLGLSLKIIGRGSEEKYLQSIAKKNIEFVLQKLSLAERRRRVEGSKILSGAEGLTDEELIGYYQSCQALIFPGSEDFGLVPIEVQACGKPVIAYNGGGVTESVIEKVTGEFFYPQSEEALIRVVKNFKPEKYPSEICRRQAKKFSKEKFKEQIEQKVKELYSSYRSEGQLCWGASGGGKATSELKV